jgi:hypothetical protein
MAVRQEWQLEALQRELSRQPSGPVTEARAAVLAAVLAWLAEVERQLSQPKATFVRPSVDIRNSLLSFRASHRTFQSTGDDGIFQLAVVGPAGMSAPREALIGWAKRSKCAIDFEFLDIESDD